MSRRLGLLLLLAAAAYVGLRVAAYLRLPTSTSPDSGTYIKTAGEPLISEGFLAGWRPLTVPLLYKVLPDSDTVRAAAQLFISIACWGALAAAVAAHVRSPRLRVVAAGLVLLFSLSVWITIWDAMILSESLALSLGAAALAAWLLLARSANAWTIAAVLGVMFLWAFSRDSVAYMALFSAPIALVAVRSGRRRGAVVLALGLLAIFAASWAAQGSDTSTPRRQAVMLNVIGVRVLTTPDELRYFRDRGMPLPDRVRALAGRPLGNGTGSPEPPLTEEPDAASFVRWVNGEARGTLATYLATHPQRAVEPVVKDAELLLATPSTLGSPPANTDPLLPDALAAVLYPMPLTALLAWLAVVIAAAAWLARAGLARPVWLVPALTILFQLPHALIVWHGDINEIPRHALPVAVLTRLGLLVLSILLVDAALEWWASRSDRRVHQHAGGHVVESA